MRRLTVLMLVALMGCLSVCAEEITQEQALEKARQFMPGKQFGKVSVRRASAKECNPYYVFNAENNGGFVVIAGNDLMPEVLGHADHGHLDLSKAPDNVKCLFDYYAEVAKSLKNVTANSTMAKRIAARRTTAAERSALAPLMTTKWNQDGIYQQYCPQIGEQKALTGCVATAMAQVVNYFQWPLNVVRESVGYTSNKDDKIKPQIDLETLPARKFNWFNMSDDDIAWLMRYCGQSVLMNYNTDESTAYATSIPGALISVFNFSKATDIVEREEFTDEEWEQVLYHEIELGRPVIYSGYKDQSGHTFVLHGYKDGEFYINWGWGGTLDGYFKLTALTPGTSDFTERQNAVVGVQPASNNDVSYDDKPEIGFLEVHVETQGQLATLLPESDRYRISRLKVTGVVGGADIDVIRDMTKNRYGGANQGRLSKLDLSEARIVSGVPHDNGLRETYDDQISFAMFGNCYTLTSFILPSTLKSIGGDAFYNTQLTEITIPESVNSIDGSAFAIRSLNSIQVEEGNQRYYSQNNALYERATGVLIRGCKASGIPEGVEEIGNSAFESAELESIVLPKSLKKIGRYAFAYNDKVNDVYIPAGVMEVGVCAFFRCHLAAITIDPANPYLDGRNNCNAIIETETNKLIQASDGTTAIPSTVKTLAAEALAYLEMHLLEIPLSVTSFRYAFENIKAKAIRVYYPTPIDIEENAFDEEGGYYLPKNIRLIVPDGTKELYAAATGWKVFTQFDRQIVEASEYENNRDYTITVSTAGTLESYIPADKKNIIEKLTVKGEINGWDIEKLKGMCGQNGMLSSIDLSDASIVNGFGATANTLPSSAFVNTTNLRHIVLPKNLTAIEQFAFQDSGIEELVVPATVTSIGRDVFYYAYNLKALSVEAGNTVFDSRDNCNAIIETATNTLRIGCVNTVIPATVTALGDMAFSGVPALKEISIPNTVTSLGWATFWADTELSTVKLSESVTELGESPFGACNRITSFTIDPANPKYDSRNNCNAIIEKATNKLIQGFATTKIPDDVKVIAAAAFRSLASLTEMEIPASVQKIEPEAFLYCNKMTKVTTHIKKPFAVSSMVFNGDNMKIAKLYVPYGTKQAYANTPGWSNFPYIIEMEPVEGEYAHNAASVVTTDFGKGYAALNGQVAVPVTLAGEGLDEITNIDYTITTGGVVTEHHLELTNPITFMMNAEVLIPIEADASVGEREKVFTLTKVNGKANECTTENMTASGKLVTVAKKPKVVLVLEEATGTWCGWCARGIPALALLNKIYKDNVITIAVHGGGGGDPMILDGYQLNASGYPSCQVNRGEFVDPYYGSGDQAFGISREIEAVQRSYVPAGIEVEAEWKDESQQQINIKTTTTFVENVAEANYRIGYLLVEDGQKGTESGWEQSNYYAGSKVNDENLTTLTESASKMTNVTYNYVPVAAYEPFNGIEGSVPATITADEAMEHNYVMDITTNTRIQDKKKLGVVALLIDKTSGKIVNAAKFKFEKDSGSGQGLSKGDANGDGKVTITDAVAIVNYILGNPSADFNADAADVSGDGNITITDAVGVVNIILNQGASAPAFDSSEVEASEAGEPE